MKQIWNFIFSWVLRLIVKLIFLLTGKGGGKFAPLLPKGQTFLVTNYCDRYKFNVDTTYPMEGSIWLGGVYDVTTTKFFREVLREGDIFLDIGANCGAIAFLAASIIGNGKVYAFEPAPTIRERLQANINLNPQLKDVVEVVSLGVGVAKEKLFYYEDPKYRGNGTLQALDGIAVDVISLYDWVLLENIEKIDVIKIDVEGMEYDVFLGAEKVLKKYHPLLYFETLPIFYQHTSHHIKTIYEFLASLGYQIVSPIEPHSQIPFDGPYPPNSVAIHTSHADRLKLF